MLFFLAFLEENRENREIQMSRKFHAIRCYYRPCSLLRHLLLRHIGLFTFLSIVKSKSKIGVAFKVKLFESYSCQPQHNVHFLKAHWIEILFWIWLPRVRTEFLTQSCPQWFLLLQVCPGWDSLILQHHCQNMFLDLSWPFKK